MLDYIPDLIDRKTIKSIKSMIQDDGFVDGRKTAGFRAKNVKKNEQLDRNFAAKNDLNKIVLDSLKSNDQFRRTTFFKKIQDPLISRYKSGMEYGYHVDDALMGSSTKSRTDISVTVFLNDPGDYEGGSLEIESPFGPQSIKLPAGCAVYYPSSTLHRVEPVTKGERLVAVTWLQSYIRDVAQREILCDLDTIRRKLHTTDPKGTEADLAFKTYANLLRRWSDT
jgi:PKHD-type hydroxylase